MKTEDDVVDEMHSEEEAAPPAEQKKKHVSASDATNAAPPKSAAPEVDKAAVAHFADPKTGQDVHVHVKSGETADAAVSRVTAAHDTSSAAASPIGDPIVAARRPKPREQSAREAGDSYRARAAAVEDKRKKEGWKPAGSFNSAGSARTAKDFSELFLSAEDLAKQKAAREEGK